MKTLRTGTLIGAGLLCGLAVLAVREHLEKSILAQELSALRLKLSQSEQRGSAATAERDRCREEAEALSETAREVHRLRGEVSQLQRKVVELQAPGARVLANREKGLDASPRGIPVGMREGMLSLQEAPAAIQAAIQREMGAGSEVRGILAEQGKNGRMTFGIKGLLEDGRAIGFRLADDGSVVEKRMEIPAETVPPQLQQIFSQNFADFPMPHAVATLEEGDSAYELTAKRPDSAVQVTVRTDGFIEGYSAKFRAPEKQP